MILAALLLASGWPFAAISGPHERHQSELWSPSYAINRGRMHIQKGELPQAIVIFRAGVNAFPANHDLQQDLITARTLIDPPFPTSRSREYSTLSHYFSLRDLFLAFLSAVLLAGFAAFKRFTTRPLWAWPLLAGSLVVAAMILMFAVICHRQIAHSRSIEFGVINRPTTLREGNGSLYPARSSGPLAPGVEVTIRNRRGGWVQVELPDGIVGWLPEIDVLHHN